MWSGLGDDTTISTPAASAPLPVGETFWDFVNSTSAYNVQTFAQKYQVALLVGGAIAAVALFFAFGARK